MAAEDVFMRLADGSCGCCSMMGVGWNTIGSTISKISIKEERGPKEDTGSGARQQVEVLVTKVGSCFGCDCDSSPSCWC